ncbi:MAG: acetoacetate decarboxylase family protein [Raineya sp.]|jgi:hypothetical protein|nr:acetoacetate decarboxylase family protein [Raineya sp.]
MMPQPSIVAPAPWTLRGNGYIFLYRFSKEFIEQQGFLKDFHQKATFKGMIGSVMLVDYHTSEVGGYKELLFIPGLFNFGKKTGFNISKIYVSTYESVYNGIQNWGIPKELADFTISQNSENQSHFEVKTSQKTFFQADIKSYGIPFYINTALFPFNFYQPLEDKTLLTQPQGKGWAKLCKLKNLQVDSTLFPDISTQRPLVCMAVRNFTMKFPVAKNIAL